MKRGSLLALAVAILVQAGLAIDSMRGNSATFDEGAHLPAGYSYLTTGDHRMNPEQPPLVKLLAAAPLVAAGARMRTDDRAWQEGRQWEFGRRFLYRWNDARRMLLLGRLPIVALASCLVAAVFLEARRRFGATAAAAAAGLAALSPDVLAHGSLVTTDLAFALFSFLAVAAFGALLERATPVRLLGAGLLAGAAFATKFSAPVLVPLLALLGLLAAVDGGPLRWRIGRSHGDGVGRGARVLQVTALLAGIGVLSLFVVWAAYGFHHALSPDPAVRASLGVPLARTGVGAPLRAVTAAAEAGLLPEDYARGFLFVIRHSEARPAFLMGELSERPFPHFFLVTFLLKTPVPLLLLVLLALARLPRHPIRQALFLWLPVGLYAAVTASRGLQIGHRHLLPVYPFLFVAAGEAVAKLVAWRRPLGVLLVGALGAWHGLSTLRAHPHHLAYFNEIAGGPANGWRLLVDSSLDWGQDLERLAAWMRSNDVPRLKLSYFGSADPAYYGIEFTALPGYSAPHAAHVTREVVPGDILAVSVTNLQGVYLDAADRPLMARLRPLRPIGRAGWSIRIYRADFSWPEAPR